MAGSFLTFRFLKSDKLGPLDEASSLFNKNPPVVRLALDELSFHVDQARFNGIDKYGVIQYYIYIYIIIWMV